MFQKSLELCCKISCTYICTYILNYDNRNYNNVSLVYLLELIVTSLICHYGASDYIPYTITSLKNEASNNESKRMERIL